MNPNEKVGLGCGTFILIALIVMIFGNMGRDRYEPQINALQQSVEALNTRIETLEDKIDRQTETIEALREEIRNAGSGTSA